MTRYMESSQNAISSVPYSRYSSSSSEISGDEESSSFNTLFDVHSRSSRRYRRDEIPDRRDETADRRSHYNRPLRRESYSPQRYNNRRASSSPRLSRYDAKEQKRRSRSRDDRHSRRSQSKTGSYMKVVAKRSRSRSQPNRSTARRNRSTSRRNRSTSRRDRYTSRRSHSDDRRGHSNDRRSHSNDRRSHSNDRRRHYNDRRGHSNDRRSHFNDRRSHSNDRRRHYNDRRSHSNDRRSHFNDRRSHSNDRRRHYNDRQSHSNDRRNRPSYLRNGSTDRSTNRTRDLRYRLRQSGSHNKSNECGTFRSKNSNRLNDLRERLRQSSPHNESGMRSAITNLLSYTNYSNNEALTENINAKAETGYQNANAANIDSNRLLLSLQRRECYRNTKDVATNATNDNERVSSSDANRLLLGVQRRERYRNVKDVATNDNEQVSSTDSNRLLLSLQRRECYRKAKDVTTNDNEQVSSTDSNRLLLDVQRPKIEFNLGKPLKQDKLIESNVFDEPITPTTITSTTTNIKVVRSKLSMLLKTALNSRTNNVNVHEVALEASPPSKENIFCNAKVSKEPSSIDLLIDEDIIRKIASQQITVTGNAPSSESPKNDPYKPSPLEFNKIQLDVDSAEQAEVLEDNCVVDNQWYAETKIENSSSIQITNTNQSKAETPQRPCSQIDTQRNTSTVLEKSRSRERMVQTNSNLPVTSINQPIPSTKLLPTPSTKFLLTPSPKLLPTPSTKFAPTPSTKLVPTPSTKLLPNPFRAPALPKNNVLKPNKMNIPIPINQRRSTVDPGRKPLQVKRGAPIIPHQPSFGLWNFKIPKISKTVSSSSTSMSYNTTTTNKSILSTATNKSTTITNKTIPSTDINKSNTTINKSILSTATKKPNVSSTSKEPNPSTNESYLQANVETKTVIEIDDDIMNTSVSHSNEDTINQHNNHHSTASQNVLNDKNPSQKETSMTAITELMNSNKFATLIEIMGQIVALKKDANGEVGSGLSTPSSFGNIITATGKSTKQQTTKRGEYFIYKMFSFDNF